MGCMGHLEAVMRLHQRNLALRRAGKTPLGVGAMIRFRSEGMPGRPPAPGRRLAGIALGMEWDAAAKESRAGLPYRGSAEDTRNQLGENLPTSPNGSRTRRGQ